jgi:hypothetical protein
MKETLFRLKYRQYAALDRLNLILSEWRASVSERIFARKQRTGAIKATLHCSAVAHSDAQIRRNESNHCHCRDHHTAA